MALMQCAGADVIHAEIHMPIRGAWWANLKLDTASPPAFKQIVTLSSPGLSLTGYVAKVGTFLDSSFLHVVGGQGSTGLLVGPFAFSNALLGDPLQAIMNASRESLSSSVSQSLLRMQLGAWTVTQRHVARQLDELCWAAQQQLGGVVNWRTLTDGTIWLGQETWPTASLPPGADIVMQHPVNPWFEIGCESPTLTPGVNLTDIGSLNVGGVDHWIEETRCRTWVWTV